MQARKKMVMVFPPAAMPTSPPLGVAMLKGFIEREMPDWEVKVLDLNLWCFDRLFELLESGEASFSPAFFLKLGATPESLLASGRYMKGQSGQDFCAESQGYDQHAEILLRFIEEVFHILREDCQAWHQEAAVAPLLQEMLDLILSQQGDLVGISVLFSTQLPVAAMLGEYLRTQCGLKVFLGGGYFAQGTAHFLRWYPQSADVIVSGDGEDTLRRLLDSDGVGQGIPGTVQLRDGQFCRTPPLDRQAIDCDGAPNFDDFDLHAYYAPEPVLPVLLARGCCWRRGTFCAPSSSAGSSYRLHSPDFVIKLLKAYVAQGIRHFALIGEMVAPDHFARFAHAVIKADLDIAYFALAKPSLSFSAPVLADMAASGCKFLLWGFESGSQRILDLMERGTPVQEMATVFQNAHAAGIANHLYVRFGFPTETTQEFEQTLDFLRQNRAHIAATHPSTFALESGSPVFTEQEKFGITRVWLKADTSFAEFWAHESVNGASPEQVAASFCQALPFLRSFSQHATLLANFRDHALIVYAGSGGRLPTLRCAVAQEPAIAS